jgi:hypothetical protein
MQWLRHQRLAAAHEWLQNPLPTDSVGPSPLLRPC